MSFYICVDIINDQLEELSLGNLTPLQRVTHFFSSTAKEQHRQSTIADQSFLNNLKDKLSLRIQDDNYAHLSEDIESIFSYLAKNKHTSIKDRLIFMLKDFRAIDALLTKTNKQAVEIEENDLKEGGIHSQISSKSSPYYKRFQTPEYRVAKINQDKLYKLGKSLGECHGFTYAMVDPKLSPYKNPGMKIDLNQEIHNYQKFQSEREKDQKSVKRTRLTREHFCPDPEKQAKQIFDVAKEYKGKELYLSRRGSVGEHACYLSVQDDGQIRYMDPNYGAYLFKDAKDFTDFYVAAAKNGKELGADFRFYGIDELKYDEKGALAESKIWQGTMRSFLTGSKYIDNDRLANAVTSGIYTTLGAEVGAGVGAGIGAAIGSLVPIMGTFIGALVGIIIGAVVGGSAGKLLNYTAAKNGHRGLLGVPHLIQDNWHTFKENLSSFIFPTPQKANDSEVVVTDEKSLSSTSKILSQIDTNLPHQKSGVTEEVINAQCKTDRVTSKQRVNPEEICSISENIKSDNFDQIEQSSGDEIRNFGCL